MLELMSGLKINFMKSEILLLMMVMRWLKIYSDFFNCQVGQFHIKYLRVPVIFTNLKNLDWDILDAGIFKKLDA
jgi:hypothetical protein